MKSARSTYPCARRTLPVGMAKALAMLFAVIALPAAANSFVVDTGTDGSQNPSNKTTCAEVNSLNQPTGHCSLRAAIAVGNGLSGSHTITFAPTVLQVTVQNGGLPTLQASFTITGNLPVRTIINGTWQTSPLQQVDCLDLTDSGDASLQHQNGANGSTIANLSIVGCAHYGISANGHGYTFTNNYIGVDPTGTTAIANASDGISLSASFAYEDQFIDTAALQTLNNALPTQPVNNAQISNFSVNLATALQNFQPNTIIGNVISGNAGNGIALFSENLGAVFVSGNFIGTDPTGNVAIGNQASGIALSGGTFANLISGNTISGNVKYGIDAESGAVYMPNFIMGNRIGLPTVQGTHVGNGLDGIYTGTYPNTDPAYFNPSSTSLIIGPSNLIADSQGPNNSSNPDDVNSNNAGVVITGSSTGVKVVGNTIGIAEFPLGTPYASKAYGNVDNGIVVTTSGNKIGGSGATDGNIIAGNGYHGILVTGSATTGNSILGNSIGVHPGLAGNLTLGNGSDGIHIDSASSTAMGGTGSTDFNTVVANGRNGIKIVNGGSQNGWGNVSQQNLVYHNGVATAGIGFDLDYAQNATNPLHTEIPQNYTNLDQAQPVICAGPADTGACSGSTAPASSGGSTTLQWTIATHGPANFRMEFYSVNNADPNQAMQMTYLGNQLITTDVNGVPNSSGCSGGVCSTSLAVATGGAFLLMNTTDITALTDIPGGGTDWKANLKCFIGTFGIPTSLIKACTANNTSEFSNAVNVPLSPPSATTTAATTITDNSATLNGTVNDNGSATSVTFEYGIDTNYGTTIAATPATVAAGSGSTAVSATLSSLACGTTYHFRVDANNGVGGTVHGNDLSFDTTACPAQAPTVATTAATAITATGATLNGIVNDNGAATAISFEYGPDANYGTLVTAIPSSLAAGAGSTAITGPTSGLTCATTYHFRIKANNAGGIVFGNDMSFNTAVCPVQAPASNTGVATAITATSATLNGTVSADGTVTAVSFDYGTTGAYGSNVVATQSPLAANANNAPVSAVVSALACGQTYHFRVNANNGAPSASYGVDQTFTTSACIQAPASNTGVATAITATSATLNGTVSSDGTATAVSFDYGTTSAYGSNVVATQSPLAANANNAPVSAVVSALACGQTYHFRVNANNGAPSASYGVDQTFTTSACAAQAPTATSIAATAVTATSATINATVNANGAATTVSFSYGASAAYGSTAAASPASLPANAVGTAVSATLSGLTCGTTYHFRVDATNTNGTGHGGDLNFTTNACPVVTTFSGPTATGTGTATAVLSGGGATCTLVNPAFVATPASPPSGVSFPDGLFQFHATGCSGSITLTLTFPTAFSAGVQYWKYGPTQNQNSDHWYTLGATNGLSLASHVATFTIADGGLGDDDLTVNGTIIDAGGPSLAAAVAPQSAAVPAPALDARSLAALIALLATLGAFAVRAQTRPVQ